MTIEQKQSTDQSEREQLLHQLVHDVQTPLSVICTGLETLNAVRADASDFNEVYETIQKSGVGPLKQIIADLVEVACRQEKQNDEQN